ncbi:hypothetical protein [Bartonella sp. DGB2]|uniref:hypothetical protein n=1 Tax=Bartonella sp. DGB2 TaxID=3388426 RepID=UPI00398FBD4C
MAKRFKKSKQFAIAEIIDVQNENCTALEKENLLDIFEYTMKSMACTLASKSWYALEDYGTAKQRGIDQFTLMMERKDSLDGDDYFWVGVFENGDKRLEVMGILVDE